MTNGTVIIELPRVLGDMIGLRHIEGQGPTLAAVLTSAFEKYPGLRPHFFDEAGELRRHIRFVKNEAFWHADGPLDMPLVPGDRVMVINSVSGG